MERLESPSQIEAGPVSLQTAIDAIRNYQQVKHQLTSANHRSPTDEQLAGAMGLSQDEASMIRLAYEIGFSESAAAFEIELKSQSELNRQSQLFASVVQEIFSQSLTDRLQTVLSLYYGLDHNYQFSNRKLGRLMGVSAHRAYELRKVGEDRLLLALAKALEPN